jgi:hypothetical protein
MTQTQKAICAAGLLVGILAVTFVIIRYQKPKPPSPAALSRQVKPKLLEPTYAPTGQAVPSFPSTLLLDANSQIAQSYSVPYGNNTQSTVIYDTPDSPDKAYEEYLSVLQSEKYSILTKKQTSTLDTVYATTNEADISVMISPKSSGSSINISYLHK